MTRRLARAEIGNAVFGCLARGHPTIDDGVSATGLSYAQWRTGLQYVRDVLSHNSSAVLYDAATKRYTLAQHEIPCFIAAHIRLFTLQLRQLYDGHFVPEGRLADTPQLRAYRCLDERVQSLLDALAEVGVPGLDAVGGLSDPHVKVDA